MQPDLLLKPQPPYNGFLWTLDHTFINYPFVLIDFYVIILYIIIVFLIKRKPTMNQPATQTFSCPDTHRESRIHALENQITELAAHIHAATFRFLELIREYDECNGWEGPGLRSCAHWLNWKCGIGLGAAREKVRVAHALKELPQMSAALRNGEISYSKVRALTREATTENEAYMLSFARHATASHVERLVRNYRKVKRNEALERDKRRHALRELCWYVDDDGSWVCRGRFTPEQGALIQKAIEAAMDEAFDETKNVPAGTSAQSSEFKLNPRPEPIATRRADALLRVAEGYLSGSNSHRGGDRYLVHVHTDMETLQANGSGAEAQIDLAGNVCAETSRRLACDTGVVHWLEDKNGQTLDIGRKTRTIPAAIRRALQRRDAGCRFPGCTATRFVDAHHIQHWADGGETKLDNLVLLCRHHHRLVHEVGFGVDAGLNSAIHFTNPKGNIIPTGPETRSRGNVFALMTANHRSGINITPRTGECWWLGERMDDDMAVDGLLQRE